MSYRACRAGLVQWTWPWLAPPPSYVLRGWKEASQQRTWLCFEHFEAFVWFPLFYLRDLRNNPRLVPATSLLVLLLPVPLLPRVCPPDLPRGCEGLTVDQQLPRKEAVQGSDLLPSRHKSPACHLARTPARAPAERSPRLGSSWELPSRFGGTSLAVPIAQHAAVLTQKQIKTADSTGLHMCPFCKPTGTPSCPAATFADTAGALCILRARGILFWLEAPVNPVPRPLLGPRFRVLEGFAHGDEQAILKNSLKNKTETL